jgi:DNA-binding response OmpR family regulator
MEKIKVLIVDDDLLASKLLALGLEKTGGFEVRVLNVSTAAVATARKSKPDIIFLDVCMPGADGGEVAFELRNDSVLGTTPIVFLTSLVSGDEAKIQGGAEYLPKPANLQKVVACIDRHIQRPAAA